MIDIKTIHRVYFIGIGGIGMSALARYFKFHGRDVSGYDKTESALTRLLVAEGIPVHYEENLELIPLDTQLVVYTPAVPETHKELIFFRENQYVLLKRSDVLGAITNSSFNICVAGTHGKTTITTMIAHLLRHSGYGCNAFLGGISVNYNTNFWSSDKNVCVVEADEYDRSFLKLSPDIAVITAMDPDHLDIYGTPQAVQDAFIEFSARVKPEGLLVSKFGLQQSVRFESPHRMTYGLGQSNADARAEHVRMDNGSYVFDVIIGKWVLQNVKLNMGGMHNVENVTAAIAVAQNLGIENERIREAVETFRGVKRRFEYVIKNQNQVFIDDYGHHPEELRALISSVKSLFPGKPCIVIFQPHLYSRTRDFAEGFAESLDLANEVYLLPIYPAREMPMQGVTSEIIASKMRVAKVVCCNKEELMVDLELRKEKGDPLGLLVTAGAGDIDRLVEPIKVILERK